MPQGCWIELFETPDFSGERRRFYGPATLDGFVWARFGPIDRISLRIGPGATALLTRRDGTELSLQPCDVTRGCPAAELASMAIGVAANPRSVCEEERDEAAVFRSVGDGPMSPVPPARSQPRRPPVEPEAELNSGAAST